MENATKALLMAAGVLIGIVILSLGVYLYGTIGNYVQMSQEEMNNQALIKFNTQFYNYTAIENQQYTFQDEKIVGDSKQLADWLAKNYSTHYTCKAEDMTVNSANRVNKIVFKKVND